MSTDDSLAALIEAVETLADKAMGQESRNRVQQHLDRARGLLEDPETWGQDTLETMDYDELRSIAADYEDINANASRDDLIEALDGRDAR